MEQLSKQASTGAQRRGSAMVMVTFATAVLATLSFSILAVSLAGMKEQRGSKEDMRARYVCEAGLSEAVFELSKGNGGNVGSAQQPVAYDGASYWVQATALPNKQVRLVGTGDSDRAGARVEMTLQGTTHTIFVWGAFGDTSMVMDSNARVDSYDSTLGTYASQVSGSGTSAHADSNGDIGSNNSVTLKSNTKVWGDATPGPSGVTTQIGGSTSISGSTMPMAEPIEMPVIEVPIIPSLGNKNVVLPLTLPSGDYHYNNFTVNSSVTVVGPARIVFENFELKSNSTFLVNAAAGPVEVFVMDDFILGSNTQMRPTDNSPKNLQVNLLSDNIVDPGIVVQLDEITFDSNAKFYGTLYAPDSYVAIESNFELFGSLVAKKVLLNSNALVHFDEELLDTGKPEDTTYEILCWRALPYKP
jgi:hypothetical protein